MLVKLEQRLASTDDISWLIELRRKTMLRYLEDSGLDVSESSLRDRVLHRFDLAQIIYCATERIGMIKVDRSPELWTVIQIQIFPQFQGRGIASRLINQIVSKAHGSSIGVGLSVLKVNPARSLYERLGFIVLSEDEHSYEMQNKWD